MLICWNVNSVNSRADQIVSLIKNLNPAVLLLQETKCTTKNFPLKLFTDLGYNLVFCGQKRYNGVAIISKSPLEEIIYSLPGLQIQEARYIEATTIVSSQRCKVISVYVPNGSSIGSESFVYKKLFLDVLKKRLDHLKKTEKNIIIAGDFNVAPDPIDVYSVHSMSEELCFHQTERIRLKRIINSGFIDSFRSFNRDKKTFTWWDYRGRSWQQNQGLRIDHILISPSIADITQKANILTETRSWKKPSDHSPISISW
jgi:exodeoxyribonuclease-3